MSACPGGEQERRRASPPAVPSPAQRHGNGVAAIPVAVGDQGPGGLHPMTWRSRLRSATRLTLGVPWLCGPASRRVCYSVEAGPMKWGQPRVPVGRIKRIWSEIGSAYRHLGTRPADQGTRNNPPRALVARCSSGGGVGRRGGGLLRSVQVPDGVAPGVDLAWLLGLRRLLLAVGLPDLRPPGCPCGAYVRRQLPPTRSAARRATASMPPDGRRAA